MSYKQQQDQWLKRHKLREGHEVRVVVGLPSTNFGLQYGFTGGFTKDMHRYVGEIGVIEDARSETGVSVEFEDGSTYWFPFFCLEPVGDPEFQAAVAAFQSQQQSA